MGKFLYGVWHSGWDRPSSGNFARESARFRKKIAPNTEHPPEAGRYHLYVSYACPWAHRTLIVRALRGLEEAISVTVVDPKMGEEGWVFQASDPDPHFGASRLGEIYIRNDPQYSGKVTVPVLWDKTTRSIVNNESREIMRMIDTEFDVFASSPPLPSLAPPSLRAEVDAALDAIYEPINNGVYRAGFATQQAVYEKACRELFEALAHWDRVLGTQRFLCGDVVTEADVAMFTTCLRFDLVYYSHFKCNQKRLADHPNLWRFLREMYQMAPIRKTCDLGHIKTHYYFSQENVNPTRIVPLGPEVDLDAALA